MAINQNHLFEELNGVKCAVVEKNVLEQRTAFLKELLEYNHYTVVVVPSPPPKAAPAKPVPPATGVETTDESAIPAPLPPATFTVGVTDVRFNAVNAIFGRLLKAAGGHTVTLAFWHQRGNAPNDEIPYFEDNQ